MALHRDIYWVGRQWAVTGYGVQACDQKQKSQFDIEVNRLWEDDVLEGLRAHKWLNVEDFEKAIAIARKRFPRATSQDSAAGGYGCAGFAHRTGSAHRAASPNT